MAEKQATLSAETMEPEVAEMARALRLGKKIVIGDSKQKGYLLEACKKIAGGSSGFEELIGITNQLCGMLKGVRFAGKYFSALKGNFLGSLSRFLLEKSRKLSSKNDNPAKSLPDFLEEIGERSLLEAFEKKNSALRREVRKRGWSVTYNPRLVSVTVRGPLFSMQEALDRLRKVL